MAVEMFNNTQKPVFFDNDGSADDILALITLLSLDHFRLTGVCITEANCFISSAIDSTLKVLDLFGVNQIKLGVSDSVGLHQFPESWRQKSKELELSDVFQFLKADLAAVSKEEAVDFFAHCLLEEQEKTTVVLTGPATNVVNAITKYPEIVAKIDRILWQAGAFLADGNAIAPDVDGSAEWNIFWDQVSAQKLLKSGIPLFLFPLDVCYQVPIDNYLIFNLSENTENRLCLICSQLLNYFDVQSKKKHFHALLPVLFLKHPEMFQLENSSIDIEQRGTSVGNIFRSSLGARIKYAKRVDDEEFGDLFIELLENYK